MLRLHLDFAAQSLYFVNLTGNLALATANLAWGQQTSFKITSDASVRTLTFQAGWIWIGCAASASIAASKTGLLELFAFGTDDTGVLSEAYLLSPICR